MTDKKKKEGGTESLFTDLSLPLDSVQIDHEETHEEIENQSVEPTQELKWEPVVNEPPESVDEKPDPVVTEHEETFEELSHEVVASAVSELTPVSEPASINGEEWGSLVLSEMHAGFLDRKKLREIQESIGAIAENPFHLKVSWPEDKAAHREIFNRSAQHWLKPREWIHLMKNAGQVDVHKNVEKAVAHRLWRLLRHINVEAVLVPSSATSRTTYAGKTDGDALSYSSMTRELFSGSIESLPIMDGDLSEPHASQVKTHEKVEASVALPDYYDENDSELTRGLAERMIRLKAVESLSKCISHFSYKIQKIDGLRWLIASGKQWK